MNVKTKEIYSEVYQILNLLGNEYINKLPNSLFNMLKEKREVSYNPQYTDKIPLNEQGIKKETIAVIALLYLNYWCENENERIELEQILTKNENEYQAQLKEKYNPDNLFKKKNQEDKMPILDNQAQEMGIAEEEREKLNSIVPYKKSIFKRLLNKIREIFVK